MQLHVVCACTCTQASDSAHTQHLGSGMPASTPQAGQQAAAASLAAEGPHQGLALVAHFVPAVAGLAVGVVQVDGGQGKGAQAGVQPVPPLDDACPGCALVRPGFVTMVWE